jgi:hypothetical protein
MRFVVARYEKDADSPDSVTDLSTVDVNAVSAYFIEVLAD